MSELREALDAFEVATPEQNGEVEGVFIAPATLDQVKLVWEYAMEKYEEEDETAVPD